MDDLEERLDKGKVNHLFNKLNHKANLKHDTTNKIKERTLINVFIFTTLREILLYCLHDRSSFCIFGPNIFRVNCKTIAKLQFNT